MRRLILIVLATVITVSLAVGASLHVPYFICTSSIGAALTYDCSVWVKNAGTADLSFELNLYALDGIALASFVAPIYTVPAGAVESITLQQAATDHGFDWNTTQAPYGYLKGTVVLVAGGASAANFVEDNVAVYAASTEFGAASHPGYALAAVWK